MQYFNTKESNSESYSDQTGKFLITSSRGNTYIFILYHYITNTIHAVPIKGRDAQYITQAWKDIFVILKRHGEAPNIHILDNKCSNEMKKAFNGVEVKYQLVRPHVHICNATERAICTIKNHSITGLCICDTRYPARELNTS